MRHFFKKRWKQIYTLLDNIAGNPMIYDYQKTLFKLTIVLLVAIFFVIRGSTAPLINQNSILHWFFYSDPNGDKTIYNIGISVIAGYIFYFVQVYIPEKRRVKRKILGFSESHRHEIYILNQYILAWKQFLKEEGICQFHEFEYTLNHYAGGALTIETYEETIEELVDCLKRIIGNPEFADSDYAYKDFIIRAAYTIHGHLKFMDDQFPRWSDKPLDAKDYQLILSMVIGDMEKIQKRLSSIEKYYLEVLTVKPYRGKSKLQKFADNL